MGIWDLKLQDENPKGRSCPAKVEARLRPKPGSNLAFSCLSALQGQLNQRDFGGSVWESNPPFATVAQVAHLRPYSKDVSGCSTASYEFSYLVRNEEAGGSNALSYTKFFNVYAVFWRVGKAVGRGVRSGKTLSILMAQAVLWDMCGCPIPLVNGCCAHVDQVDWLSLL